MLVEIFDKDAKDHTTFFILECSDEQIKEISSTIKKVWEQDEYNTKRLKDELATIDNLKFIYDVTNPGNIWRMAF